MDFDLAAIQARAREIDEAVAVTVERLGTERDSFLAPLVTRVKEAEEAWSAADCHAAEKASAVGALHDPAHPSEEAIIRVQPLTEAEAAWKLKVPHGSNTFHTLVPVVSWLGTVVCGVMIGVSAALASGALHPNDVFKEPKIGALIISGLMGIFGVSIFIRGALTAWGLSFFQSFYCEQPRRRQVSWFLALAFVALFLGCAVVALDNQGILRAALAHSAFDRSSQETSQVTWYLITCALSVAYLLFCVGEAALKARKDPIGNAVVGYIADDFRNRVEERRSNPKVQEALRALSGVLEAARAKDWAVAHVQEVQAKFAELMARAEAQRIEYPLEWTPTMRHTYEDARENLVGIHIEMNALISDFFAMREAPVNAGRGGRK